MRRILVTCVGVVVAAMTGARDVTAQSLRDAVDAAVQHNPAVAAAQANRRATAFELLESQGRKLPRVELDADVGEEKIDRPRSFSPDVNDTWRTRRQAALSLSQPLFDGWDRINDIYKNAARVDSAAWRVLARAEVLALEAVEAYISVVRAEASLVASRANVAALRRLQGRVREQVTAGKVPASEIDQTQERIESANVVVERIAQTVGEAEVAFHRVTGLRPKHLQKVGYPSGVPMDRESAVASGFANSAILAAADSDATAARYTYEQLKSSNYPYVGLEVRGSTGADLAGTPGPSRELSARVVLKWTLFDGLIARNRQMEFAERWSQVTAEAEDRRRGVRAEIERSLVNYVSLQGRLRALRNQAAAAKRVYANYETEYALGKRSLLDLLGAQNAMFSVQIEVLNTEAAHVFSAYRVLSSIGSLLSTIHIAPPAGSDVGALSRSIALGRRNAWEPIIKRHQSHH